MREHEIHPAPGARKERRRVGRGNSSGRGTYSGRGIKGQKARSGGGVRPGFEGGQIPFVKRMPHKRGFKNPFRVEFQAVNLVRLAQLSVDQEVTPELLQKAGIIKTLRKPVAILGDGELSTSLSVRAHKFSASAREKILAAGGKTEDLPVPKISRPR